MNIKDFLLARIAEDEELARDSFYEGQSWLPEEEAVVAGDQDLDLVFMMDRKRDAQHAAHWSPTRVLAECAAKRAIIKQHEAWPVRVSESVAPSFEATAGTEAITLRMTQRMVWLTEREYVKRFGVEPPTAPMLLTLAAIYADHPDYQQRWAV